MHMHGGLPCTGRSVPCLVLRRGMLHTLERALPHSASPSLLLLEPRLLTLTYSHSRSRPAKPHQACSPHPPIRASSSPHPPLLNPSCTAGPSSAHRGQDRLPPSRGRNKRHRESHPLRGRRQHRHGQGPPPPRRCGPCHPRRQGRGRESIHVQDWRRMPRIRGAASFVCQIRSSACPPRQVAQEGCPAAEARHPEAHREGQEPAFPHALVRVRHPSLLSFAHWARRLPSGSGECQHDGESIRRLLLQLAE